MNANLNKYISKRHINAIAKFNEELNEFAKLTGEEEAQLYEDAYTSFTMSNVRLENGELVFNYDGSEERETIVKFDEEVFLHNIV